MTRKTSYLCFDRIIPPEYRKIARHKAKEENPANIRVSTFEAATLRSKLWERGRTLRVAFLDGSPLLQAKVEHYAHQWSQYANVTFAFGSYPDAEIRISFRGTGSWSAVGTDALVEEYFPRDQATMNYDTLAPDSPEIEDCAVVLHEFGHALGMIHEHQQPAAFIQWNEPVVIAALSGPPNYWDEQTTRFNFFERYEQEQTQFTCFDSQSIMLYSFPKAWTKNGLEFPKNYTLSLIDKEFINQCYPW